MSTTIQNPSRSSGLLAYKDNKLMVPFFLYHRKVYKTFSPLPKEGKPLDVAKRIGRLAIAPFAYLTLGATALIGYAFHSQLTKSKTITKIDPIKVEDNAPEDFKGAVEHMRKVLSTTLDMKNTTAMKVLVGVRWDTKESKFFDERVIKKADNSPIDTAFFAEQLSQTVKSAQQYFPHPEGKKVRYDWCVFLKDNQGQYKVIGGARETSDEIKAKQPNKCREEEQKAIVITAQQVNEFYTDIEKSMRILKGKTLNAQGDFT